MQQLWDGQLICPKPNHNMPIIMLAVNECLQASDMLICSICLQNNPEFINAISVNQAKKIQTLNNSKVLEENLKQLALEYDYLHQIKKQAVQKSDLQNNVTISSIRLTQKFKQISWSFASAFNYSGSILAAGHESDIKIWKSIGKFKQLRKLIGHTAKIKCIVFSKKCNWFASGSEDKTIRCWKESNNCNWESSQPGQQHTFSIKSLILNKQENQMISCSFDETIIAWKVNCYTNNFQYFYTLQKVHKEPINCIAMNESETYLVSCGDDKKVILWYKNYQNKWEYESEIINACSVFRICFINDYQLVWQPNSEAVFIYEIKNGKFLRLPKSKFRLSQKALKGADLFPIIFNKMNQIFVYKQTNVVYLIKKQIDNQLKEAAVIDNKCLHNYGTISEDGTVIAIWKTLNTEFRIYKISYH